ncbi:MAG: winged helix-turn-helix domain-containing protein [Anaerolineales bacterium]|nr:winged helix-turn-helix domain-containing protein [Anaerolineales bacterium]MCB8939288.1 winged helix-turn-helix domain-containing protein [Ardenticatenaceae bacterium]
MHVYLFGNFHVYPHADAELALRPTAARLFAFLLLHRQMVHMREVVAETFWEDSELDRARRNLNTTLWQLRKAFSQMSDQRPTLIDTTPEQIKLNREADLWLDVALFEEQAKKGLIQAENGSALAAINALEQAVALYQGDLLHGFSDSWVLQERERLRLIYLRCLRRLMTLHQKQHNLDASIEYARRILHIEPWHEDVHRILMGLYMENGRRAKAIAQYHACRKALESELAVTPMAETEVLYQRLLTPTHRERQAIVAPNQPVLPNGNDAARLTLEVATAQLQAAIQTLREAQADLNRAVALVERLSQNP